LPPPAARRPPPCRGSDGTPVVIVVSENKVDWPLLQHLHYRQAAADGGTLCDVAGQNQGGVVLFEAGLCLTWPESLWLPAPAPLLQLRRRRGPVMAMERSGTRGRRQCGSSIGTSYSDHRQRTTAPRSPRPLAGEAQGVRAARSRCPPPLPVPTVTCHNASDGDRDEPVAVPIRLGAGGLDEALPTILAEMGERRPTDLEAMRNPRQIPSKNWSSAWPADRDGSGQAAGGDHPDSAVYLGGAWWIPRPLMQRDGRKRSNLCEGAFDGVAWIF
jgi:hypothetical protein